MAIKKTDSGPACRQCGRETVRVPFLVDYRGGKLLVTCHRCLEDKLNAVIKLALKNPRDKWAVTL
jgi:hypothetical protein